MNYGAIGSIIGHEIVHGFGASGRGYNGGGYPEDWWDKSTAEEYDNRIKCMIDQYDSYTVKELNMTVRT